MLDKKHTFNRRQLIFQELFIGTLVYAVVLGFLEDYTSIVEAYSFSTIFFSAVALEVLTYLAFMLKVSIIKQMKGRQGKGYRLAMFFSVWFIMFISKFVFIFALDVLFGSYISINGFFGIMAVVLSVTIIHRLAYMIFGTLGDGDKPLPTKT